MSLGRAGSSVITDPPPAAPPGCAVGGACPTGPATDGVGLAPSAGVGGPRVASWPASGSGHRAEPRSSNFPLLSACPTTLSKKGSLSFFLFFLFLLSLFV